MKWRKELLGSASRAVTRDPDKGRPEERAKGEQEVPPCSSLGVDICLKGLHSAWCH